VCRFLARRHRLGERGLDDAAVGGLRHGRARCGDRDEHDRQLVWPRQRAQRGGQSQPVDVGRTVLHDRDVALGEP